MGHKIFLVLADALNRKGIAVLRYDKRGVGGSSGDYDAATTADFTSDAQAAVDWLKTQPQIDASRVGVLGHSEGGIIAPAVAAEDKTVAFVVMIAGHCIRGDKLFVLQSAATAKAYGAPADYIAKRRVFDQELYTTIISAPSDSVALERAKAKIAQGVADKLVDANEAETLAADDISPWERYFIAYDPAPTLARLAVPILVLNGSLDVQVPAKENLAAAREALKNNSNATIEELPGMNHLLQNATSGAPNEYDGIEETISPVALGIIGDWVSRHTMPGGASKAEQMSGSEDKTAKAPLIFTFYIAAPIEKVWDGFVSKEANRAIFMGADFEVDLKPGGAMTWSGPGKDRKPMRYVTGEVIRAAAPKLLEYKFGPGDGAVKSRVKVELTQESEAVKVVVTNDEWPENDAAYAQNADGWPRILSRLKTLLETGKTFRPH